MKLKKDKLNKIPYMVTVTTQFTIYMTPEDINKGNTIPHELVEQGVKHCLEIKDYELDESEM